MAKVLVVIPHDCFRDEEYLTVTTALKTNNHTVAVGSSHHTEAKGHYGLLVKPDVNVQFVEPADYDCVIFIGGRGIEEYLDDMYIMSLLRDFFYQNKLICALGMAVEILAYSGILTGRRVTCDSTSIIQVQNAGAYYTGSLAEKDDKIITGSGVDAKEDFSQEVIEALSWERQKQGDGYARIA
jgi:protease I